MRQLIFPSDLLIRSVLGTDLNEDPKKAARAYRARLERAEAKGVLPRRIYVSPRRYAWDRDELVEALAKLPRTYSGFEQTA